MLFGFGHYHLIMLLSQKYLRYCKGVIRCEGRVLASRVSGCLLDSLVHEKYLILGKKTS